MNQLVQYTARFAGLLAASLLAVVAMAQPSITRLAPISAMAGASVAITGTGFATSAAQNAVYFGAARATVTAATATQLTVQVPVGASSIAPVTVTDLTSQRVGSSLNSVTPFFTVRFMGNGLNANSYQTENYSVATSRIGLSALTTADFNADNYADFALVADGVLRLLLSNGQGGYDPAFTLDIGTPPGYVQAADVDANGAADLLVGVSGGQAFGGQLLLLRNQGNGNGFASAITLDLGGEQLLNILSLSVDVQDLNADGLPDIVVITSDRTATSSGAAQLVELRNNGNGFDVPRVLLRDRLVSQAVADFNQDGRLDIVALTRDFGATPASLLLLARNTANTGYEAPESTSLATISSLNNSLFLADVNADGRPDLLVTGQVNTTSGVIALLRNATDFSIQDPVATGGGAANSLKAVADADGDGLPDVLVGSFTVLRGQAGGSFGQPISYNSAASTLVTGDFNNDGRSDVATFNQQNGNLTIFRYTGAGAGTNSPPTLNALPDLTLNEDDPQQTVALSGISNGGDAGQAVTLTAVSSDPSLVPNPTINYFSPTSAGTLRLRSAPDAFGTCTIAVTASDGQPQNGTITRTFRVTVNPVNDAPTLDPIADVVITNLASNNLTLPLSGITSGAANENQLLRVSSSITLAGGGTLGNGTIAYTSPATTGTFSYNVSTFGASPGILALVTITVDDGEATNNTISRTFRIIYNPSNTSPGQPTTAPTLDPIADVTANRSLATQVPVVLAGISDGDPNQVLPLTVTAVSSDPAVVTVGTISYNSPAATGSLPYTISPTRGGTVTISVTVSNGQPQNGSITRSFRVTVPQVLGAARPELPVAHTLDLYPNPALEGQFWLKSSTAGPTQVTVVDLAGRMVWQGQLASLQQPQLLRLTAPAAGMYVVKVRTTTNTFTRRVTVQ